MQNTAEIKKIGNWKNNLINQGYNRWKKDRCKY